MPDSKQSWIQPGISVGNVIVLGTLLISLAVGWTRLEAGLEDHDDRIIKLEQSAEVQIAERIKQGSDMADMKADMRWIRLTLERLERELKSRGK
ncbi:hypothetical protein FMN50_26970 [Rhodobacterales bacterium]|nr:hypothetical protein FMN50_26970 [Rhodobacterales bacterium]